ncbi:J domain-containing protein [Salinicola avicenniae]|uniref:J domain-containing protein n=1 Tax=Salinicola avicenniae TaxID=2916836 RepID=UPI002073CEB0|nr:MULTISPECIES: J domain-containing protein [unclassified Salinicola]
MALARFSPFETLLLKSQDQRQSAELLLLAWVFVNKYQALDEDRRYLESLARRVHHVQDLVTLIEAARRTDLGDIQLAAEVLLRDNAATRPAFLRQAIVLATSDGALSLRNHHILRFLADLISVAPGDFSHLYQEVTGHPLEAPGDPSRHAYWADAPSDSNEAASAESSSATADTESAIRSGWRERARQRAERQREARQHKRDQERQQAEARQRQQEAEAHAAHEREQARLAQERERRAREEARRREEQRQQDQKRYEEARQRQREQAQSGAHGDHPPYRVRLALLELELDNSASRIDIKRAYRRLAQRHHPDRFHGQSEWRLRLASQRFQRIKNAYDLLMRDA